jgi:hypothetical protein
LVGQGALFRPYSDLSIISRIRKKRGITSKADYFITVDGKPVMSKAVIAYRYRMPKAGRSTRAYAVTNAGFLIIAFMLILSTFDFTGLRGSLRRSGGMKGWASPF